MKKPVSGIELATQINPEAAAMIEALKEQLLIVFLKRLGGKVSIPCTEVDDTAQDMFAFCVDENRVFHFEIQRKS